jgi:hypothetical protein
MGEDWLETEPLPDGMPPETGPAVVLNITLPVRVPSRWAHAAAFLKIDLEEYARRRFIMERPVLGTMGYMGDDLAYEPVSLQFTPIHNFTPETK